MDATPTFTTRPELRGTFGMVASTHWLASAAGMAVLERGGNAFDAAAATGLTLQVVEPHLNGPGGDLPVVLWSAERGEPLVLCAQGTAPVAATIERFHDLGHELIPGTGVLAACVPGAFDGWMLLLRDFGTMRLADVAEYAIGYAEEGYPVVPGISATVRGAEDAVPEPRARGDVPTHRGRGGGRRPRRGDRARTRRVPARVRRRGDRRL